MPKDTLKQGIGPRSLQPIANKKAPQEKRAKNVRYSPHPNLVPRRKQMTKDLQESASAEDTIQPQSLPPVLKNQEAVTQVDIHRSTDVTHDTASNQHHATQSASERIASADLQKKFEKAIQEIEELKKVNQSLTALLANMRETKTVTHSNQQSVSNPNVEEIPKSNKNQNQTDLSSNIWPAIAQGSKSASVAAEYLDDPHAGDTPNSTRQPLDHQLSNDDSILPDQRQKKNSKPPPIVALH